MATWFTLDGVSCEDAAIHVLEFPPYTIARRKVITFQVPGAQDEHVFEGDWGYEDVELPVRCTVDEDAAPEDVISFLTPSMRRIVFGNQPAFEYTGFLTNMLEIAKILPGRGKREFTARYQCSPFKALAFPDEPLEFIAAGSIEHPGTARCYPKITVEGQGDVTITLHSVDDFTVSDLETGEPFVIDSAAMICTDSTGLLDWSDRGDGNYPYLDPGVNTLSFTGNVTKITVEPNFLWI